MLLTIMQPVVMQTIVVGIVVMLVCVCSMQGKGEFSMEYHHYQPVLPQNQAEMIEIYEKERLKKSKK